MSTMTEKEFIDDFKHVVQPIIDTMKSLADCIILDPEDEERLRMHELVSDVFSTLSNEMSDPDTGYKDFEDVFDMDTIADEWDEIKEGIYGTNEDSALQLIQYFGGIMVDKDGEE